MKILIVIAAAAVTLVVVVNSDRQVYRNPRRYTFDDFGFASGDSPVIIGQGDQGAFYYDDNYEDDDEDGAGYGSGESEKDDGIDLDLDTPGGGHMAYQWDGVESPVVIFYDETTPGTTTVAAAVESTDHPALVAPVKDELAILTLETKEKVVPSPTKDYGYRFVKVYESVVTYTWDELHSGRGEAAGDGDEGNFVHVGGHAKDAPPSRRESAAR